MIRPSSRAIRQAACTLIAAKKAADPRQPRLEDYWLRRLDERTLDSLFHLPDPPKEGKT